MVNVYEQIASNKRRSIIILTGFVGFIAICGYIIGNYTSSPDILPLALILSLFTSLGGYFAGDKIVLSLNGAKPALRQDHFDFYTVTENLSIATQIPTPKIYVIKSNAPNAFATGRDPVHAYICATTGLLDKLNRTELEGVIAHELSHIKNYDIRLMTLVSVLIGSLSILINMSYNRSFFGKSDNNDNHQSNSVLAIIGFLLIIFAPIIAQLIQLAISRQREFLADAGAVMVTRQPSGLIEALKKISADSSRLTQASTATATLYINNPFKGNKLGSLFSTHPPIAERIAALEKMM
ncbi:MAG: M48 family metalloprotease [Candidatus Shapirobacteria bacterium]|jgi:heat shock protein HtpX